MEPETSVGGFIPLAKSGDNGLIQLFEDNCRQLFSFGNETIPKNVPGLSLVSLIFDPKRNDSSLMHCILKHLLTEGRQLDQDSANEFKSKFDSDLEDLKAEYPQTPLLIAWKEPQWVNKRALDQIPVYILEIIGDFPERFMDPNYIALAGLSFVMSSTLVTVVQGSVEEKGITLLLPLAVQGLRSEQIKKYQQLHVFIMGAESKPFGLAEKELQQFWARNVNDDEISRFKTIFETFYCHKIPQPENPLFKTYFTKSLSHVLDIELTTKMIHPRPPLRGEELIDLMIKHVEDVTDAEYDNHLQIWIKSGHLAQETGDCTDKMDWRQGDQFQKNCQHQNDIDSDDEPAYEIENQSLIQEKVESNPGKDEEIDNLVLTLHNCNVTESKEESNRPTERKSKFSDRFKNKLADDEAPIEDEKQSPDEEQIIIPSPVTETIFEIEHPLTSNDDLINTAKLQEINPESLRNARCLQISKTELSQFPEEPEVSATPTSKTTVTPSVPKSKALIEVNTTPQQPVKPYDPTALYNSLIQVLDETSPDSVITSEQVVQNALKLHQEKITDPVPHSVMNYWEKKVSQDVENLILSVLQFQNDVETDFKSMTESQLHQIRNKSTANFQSLLVKSSHKNKLDFLVAEYVKVINSNGAALEEVSQKLKIQLCTVFEKEVSEALSGDRVDIEVVKATFIQKVVTTANNFLSEFVTPDFSTEFQKELNCKLLTIFAKHAKEFRRQENLRAEAIEEFSCLYKKSIEIKMKTALSVGTLAETSNKIQDESLQSYEKTFGKKDIDTLKKRMNTVYEKIKTEFKATNVGATNSSRLRSHLAPSKPRLGIYPSLPLEGREVIQKVSTMSIGVHFGLNSLAAYFWQNKTSSSQKFLQPQDNSISFVAKTFKLKSMPQHSVRAGRLFVTESKLLLWPYDNELSSISLIAVILAVLRHKAESRLVKKVSNMVLAIPSFLDPEMFEDIKKSCSFINIDLTMITETDAVAIQHFGEIGRSQIPSGGSTPPALLVVVLRNHSYDIASYVVERGQIVRYELRCCKKSKSRGAQAWDYLKSFVVDEFMKLVQSIIGSFPKHCVGNFITLVLSDSSDVLTSEIRNKLSQLVPICPSKEQRLGVCVAKGASFLADIKSKNDDISLKYWKNIHPNFSLHLETPLLFTGKSNNVSLSHCALSKIDDVKMTREITFALEILQKKHKPFKTDFKSYLFKQLKDVEGLQNVSDFLRGKATNLLRNELELVSSLDVGKKYCSSKKLEIEQYLEKIKASS